MLAHTVLIQRTMFALERLLQDGTCRTTLLELVIVLQKWVPTDNEVEALITSLVNSGRVTLAGTFAGCRITLNS